MTRKIVSFIENSSAIHNLQEVSWISSKSENKGIFGNKNKRAKLMSDHMRHDCGNALKEKLNDKNKSSDFTRPENDLVKIKSKLKKLGKKLYGKKISKSCRQKPSNRIVKLPYGCVWNGKERRFAIRVFSSSLKNELLYILSQEATKKGGTRSQTKNNNIGNDYGKHIFENVHKENLIRSNESIKLENLSDSENCLTPENKVKQVEEELYLQRTYKHVEQITEIIQPHQTETYNMDGAARKADLLPM